MPQDTPSRKLDQYIIRFPDGMRDRFKAEAERNGRSLNAELIKRLQWSLDEEAANRSAAAHFDWLEHVGAGDIDPDDIADGPIGNAPPAGGNTSDTKVPIVDLAIQRAIVASIERAMAQLPTETSARIFEAVLNKALADSAKLDELERSGAITRLKPRSKPDASTSSKKPTRMRFVPEATRKK